MPIKIRRDLLAAACILLLPCASVFAQTPQPAPGALTMQQAVDLARLKNPTILAAQQNLLSVKAQELQAAVRQNPYIALTGSQLTEPEYFNNPYNVSFGVGRLFERGQKRRWRIDSTPNPPPSRPTLSSNSPSSRPSSPSVRPSPTSSSPSPPKNSPTTT